jgi:aminopeptidase YwaD
MSNTPLARDLRPLPATGAVPTCFGKILGAAIVGARLAPPVFVLAGISWNGTGWSRTRRSARRPAMRYCIATVLLFFNLSAVPPASAQDTQHLASQQVWRDFINEASGDLAIKDTSEIVKYDRLPTSPGFAAAAQYVAARARAYGLGEVRVESFPADGKTYYNSLRSDPGWSAHSAELWIVRPAQEKLTSYAEQNLSLGDFSRSAEVTAELVDVGQGATEAEYDKTDLHGKIVLTSGSTDNALEWGVRKRGAEGIVYYSALSRGYSANPRRILWGGFYDPPEKGFEFVLTYEKGVELSRRLAAGEKLVLRASIDAEVGPSEYYVVTGIIPGEDAEHEVLFNAHLDHPAQSANDDAAGCAVLLDIARVWTKLIREHRLAPPKRTIRFIWQAEMSGSMAYVARHPEITKNTLAGIRFGVIGGEIGKTKSIYNLYRAPSSAPTFVSDLAELMLEKVFDDSIWWMPTSPLPLRIQAPTGTRDLFYSRVSPYFGGDDYTYDDPTTGFPSISFNGAPDVNRHTSDDSIDKLDTTQLKRSSFLGLSVGYMAAMATRADADWIGEQVYTRALARLAADLRRTLAHVDSSAKDDMSYALREALSTTDLSVAREIRTLQSISTVIGETPAVSFYRTQLEKQKLDLRTAVQHKYQQRCELLGIPAADPAYHPGTEQYRAVVPRRNPAVRGPMLHWSKDYLVEKLGKQIYEEAAIFKEPWWDSRTAEILNFTDGKRSVLDIADELSAEFGSLPASEVFEYFQLLKKADVVSW